MARDYRKNRAARGKGAQPRKRASNSGSVPGWVWMLGGFLPGALLAVLVHLHHQGADAPLADDDSMVTGEDAVATSRDDDSRPRFEFYKLLSEMEVVVPDEPEEPRRRAQAEPPVPDVSDQPARDRDVDPDVQYLLQAGSFRNHKDADRLKARLALMGVEAEIQSVQIHGGETWHRVRVGPMSDRTRADTVRERLKQENVESILLRTQG